MSRGEVRAQGSTLARIAPELLAAASDNDPTNMGTAALVGAQTSYQLSWVALLVAPLLSVVQSIAAQVGLVAHSDLQSLTVRRYGRRVAAVLMVSVVIVNMVTIAADLQAGAAGAGLLLGVDTRWLVLPLGAALVAVLLAGKYDEVVAVLRYLLVGFAVFVVAVILARPDWPRLLRHTVVPSLPLTGPHLAGALALLGTTLTSYVYIWETIDRGVEAVPAAENGSAIAHARIGAIAGGVFTAVILWSMLVTSAATFGQHHESVNSAQAAARALGPLAGSAAADIYASGLLVSAVVALPVLMASTAYVVGAQFDWRRGLSEKVEQARGFYAVLGASVALAVGVAMSNVSVFDMLLAASVIGGLATPIGLVVLVRLARDRQVMGEQPITRRLAAAGWAVALLTGALGLLYIFGSLLGDF